MWKIILVDDEKVIRETIGQVLRWEDMGIELAGICKNGLEAFDMIVDESPDIVLTDICMPGFSGLDLIEKVCSSQIDIEFVILSGYGEFDYAQKAMEYGVKHYILKPCDERQISPGCWQNMKGTCRQGSVFCAGRLLISMTPGRPGDMRAWPSGARRSIPGPL